jgi:hypothetical protein
MLGRPQSRSGRSGEEKNPVLPGFELRLLDRPAHSQLLYRLRFLALKFYPYVKIIKVLNDSSEYIKVTLVSGKYSTEAVASHSEGVRFKSLSGEKLKFCGFTQSLLE